ncbi:hypothetical protein CUMW_188470 [Citrus unshiu]|uniref:Myb/SANT-like domain-containing protein n=1 Tax=Citrus unshiu TaxID=55188 RepID=A0A2H5Q216_CITUN|nr:hypothetical protein CUMW_188470 [Citrus unshiu]
MEVKLLGYGLKVSLPIESQVKWFKKKYCLMQNILYVSSFGWDNEKVMITCENGVFYEYVKSRKRKSKNKSFDHMCSNIGTMVESLAAMVPKLDGLINVLSNDKNISDLQGKLYGEISKIEGSADEKII